MHIHYRQLREAHPPIFGYSGDLDFLHPGATRCNDGVKFGINFQPHRCKDGVWAPKIENFTQILQYKRPTEAYPSGDFYQLFTVCG